MEVVKTNNLKVRKLYKGEHLNKDSAVVDKAYFYKNGIAEINAERINLEEKLSLKEL